MINLGFDPLFEGEENKREMVYFLFAPCLYLCVEGGCWDLQFRN
jgi:hypothetical protein